MSVPKVTKCPECNTAFRVSQKQLKASNGSVRCGSCMSIFNALETSATKTHKQHNKQPNTEQTNNNKNKPPPISVKRTPPKKAINHPKKKTVPHPNTLIPTLLTLENSADLIVKELESNNAKNKNIQTKSYKPKLKWAFLTTVLVTIIFITIILFNKNSLSLNSKYRGFYIAICQYLHCSIPSYYDTDRIRTLELMVQQHIKHSETLIIDTIIVNEALYPQPFPLLSLTFSDINGNVIYNNIMAPHEYLGGELTGETIMQRNLPIQLSLEIPNPGQKAVNYTLNFHANNILTKK